MYESVYGKFLAESIEYFQKVIDELKSDGCDAVILSGTEIPLIINDANSRLPRLDSNQLLAEAAIQVAIF
jgi:aspartate racemase